VIELEGVGLTYPGPPPVEALRDAGFAIGRGEYVAVVGPSGSGKSTLLNVLGLLDRPTSGRYVLDGVDTGRLGAAERAGLRGSRIGFVFQSFHLMTYRTVLENVALTGTYVKVPRKRRLALAGEAIRRVGLGHRAGFMPSQLSGGERQRVAIARAVAGGPMVLLCDEPTGNLDTQTAGEIVALFEEMNAAGLTVIVVTHDRSLADRAGRRLWVRDGQLDDGARAGRVGR
jgi:putative ABC transport system ATP-binding protein